MLHQPKDIEKLFPLRSTDVVARLRVQLPDAPINSHTFQAIIFKNKIREDAQLHYRVEVANMSLFSEKVVDLIVQKARLPDWLRNARNSYAAHLREQRERRKMRKDGK